MTPYTWRNFVIGAPTARGGQSDRFFLQKRHFTYKLSVKKQKTGQKTKKNPPKKVFFPAPSTSWLSLAGYGQTISSQAGYGLGQIRPGWIWTSISGQARYGHVHIRPNSASWPEGLEKSPFLEGFCQFFVLFFAFSLTICMYKAFFAKKIGPFDLLWPLERPLQSSATYRGLPLPAMSTYKYKRHSRAIC